LSRILTSYGQAQSFFNILSGPLAAMRRLQT
jgi:hypothetical protein